MIAGLVCSAAAMPAFLLIERTSRHPMLPLGLFRSATVDVGFFVGFVMNFSYYGLLFALSLFFQTRKGYSPLLTGLTFLHMTVLAAAVNLGAGSLIVRVGPKVPLISGLLLSAAGYLSLTGVSDGTAYVRIAGPMLAIGIGSALCLPAFTVAVMGGVEADSRGMASGVLNASRQSGGILGVGIFGSLVTGASFIAGLHAALLVSATLILVAASAVALCIAPRKRGGPEAGPRACVDDAAVAEWPEA